MGSGMSPLLGIDLGVVDEILDINKVVIYELDVCWILMAALWDILLP